MFIVKHNRGILHSSHNGFNWLHWRYVLEFTDIGRDQLIE